MIQECHKDCIDGHRNNLVAVKMVKSAIELIAGAVKSVLMAVKMT